MGPCVRPAVRALSWVLLAPDAADILESETSEDAMVSSIAVASDVEFLEIANFQRGGAGVKVVASGENEVVGSQVVASPGRCVPSSTTHDCAGPWGCSTGARSEEAATDKPVARNRA